MLSRFYSAGVGSDTVMLRSGGFDLEHNRIRVLVFDMQHLADFTVERSLEAQLGRVEFNRHGGIEGSRR